MASVVVHDVTAPTALCKNMHVNLDPTGHATISTNDINNGSTDACGIASLSLDKTGFDCSNVGSNTENRSATGRDSKQAAGVASVVEHEVTTPTALCKNMDVNLDA